MRKDREYTLMLILIPVSGNAVAENNMKWK